VKTGIFGGTFNPIHNGHIFNARFIKDEFNLDRILFIPTGEPVHKKLAGNVTGELRCEMVSLAITDQEGFEVSRIELDRPEPSYTAITIRELSEKFPEDDFYLIIGADSFNELDSWREYEFIINSVPVIVMKRPGDPELKESVTRGIAKLLASGNRNIDISSSMVRDRVARGLPVDSLLPGAVNEFIKSKRLYLS